MSTEVRLYWRPGCPFCALLRSDLHRARLPLREINIWQDPAAAATVRAVAGGNETVPTVVVGDAAMVNPSGAQVLEVVRSRAPELLAGTDTDAATRLSEGAWWGAALASVVLALVWLGLALDVPNTTYHVAPLLVAAAWPLTRRWRTRSALSPRAALGTAAGGAAVALAATALLASRHALAGPTLSDSSNALIETLIAIVLGATIGGALAALRRRPRPTPSG